MDTAHLQILGGFRSWQYLIVLIYLVKNGHFSSDFVILKINETKELF